jgi:hypothetical protein
VGLERSIHDFGTDVGSAEDSAPACDVDPKPGRWHDAAPPAAAQAPAAAAHGGSLHEGPDLLHGPRRRLPQVGLGNRLARGRFRLLGARGHEEGEIPNAQSPGHGNRQNAQLLEIH